MAIDCRCGFIWTHRMVVNRKGLQVCVDCGRGPKEAWYKRCDGIRRAGYKNRKLK
jgi:hypothetical protein